MLFLSFGSTSKAPTSSWMNVPRGESARSGQDDSGGETRHTGRAGVPLPAAALGRLAAMRRPPARPRLEAPEGTSLRGAAVGGPFESLRANGRGAGGAGPPPPRAGVGVGFLF